MNEVLFAILSVDHVTLGSSFNACDVYTFLELFEDFSYGGVVVFTHKKTLTQQPTKRKKKMN